MSTAKTLNLEINSSEVLSNQAALKGGAIYLVSEGQVTVTLKASQLNYNAANIDGGLLYIPQQGSCQSLVAMTMGTNIQYAQATSGKGGALYQGCNALNKLDINTGSIIQSTYSKLGGGFAYLESTSTS